MALLCNHHTICRIVRNDGTSALRTADRGNAARLVGRCILLSDNSGGGRGRHHVGHPGSCLGAFSLLQRAGSPSLHGISRTEGSAVLAEDPQTSDVWWCAGSLCTPHRRAARPVLGVFDRILVCHLPSHPRARRRDSTQSANRDPSVAERSSWANSDCNPK